jgi:CheY-like chemotaxis protein
MTTVQNQAGNTTSFTSLVALFNRILKPKNDLSTPCAKPEPAPKVCDQNRRVLVVDDDPVFLKATENRLTSCGYKVFTASDGPSAIRTARAERPDVILLDLQFPSDLPTSWDGFGIMEWLRLSPSVSSTPMIVCTGSRDPGLTKRVKAARVAGLFTKPLNYTALMGLIDVRINSKLRAETGQASPAYKN